MRIRVLTALAVLLLGRAGSGAGGGPTGAACGSRAGAEERAHAATAQSGESDPFAQSCSGRRPDRSEGAAGDHKTPEGVYVLDSRNAHSQFYKSIHISYPSVREREAARQRGVSPGGDVFLHGLPNGNEWVGSSHRLKDWTDGCIAVTNAEMDEIWQAVADGTPIGIRP